METESAFRSDQEYICCLRERKCYPLSVTQICTKRIYPCVPFKSAQGIYKRQMSTTWTHLFAIYTIVFKVPNLIGRNYKLSLFD